MFSSPYDHVDMSFRKKVSRTSLPYPRFGNRNSPIIPSKQDQQSAIATSGLSMSEVRIRRMKLHAALLYRIGKRLLFDVIAFDDDLASLDSEVQQFITIFRVDKTIMDYIQQLENCDAVLAILCLIFKNISVDPYISLKGRTLPVDILGKYVFHALGRVRILKKIDVDTCSFVAWLMRFCRAEEMVAPLRINISRIDAINSFFKLTSDNDLFSLLFSPLFAIERTAIAHVQAHRAEYAPEIVIYCSRLGNCFNEFRPFSDPELAVAMLHFNNACMFTVEEVLRVEVIEKSVLLALFKFHDRDIGIAQRIVALSSTWIQLHNEAAVAVLQSNDTQRRKLDFLGLLPHSPINCTLNQDFFDEFMLFLDALPLCDFTAPNSFELNILKHIFSLCLLFFMRKDIEYGQIDIVSIQIQRITQHFQGFFPSFRLFPNICTQYFTEMLDEARGVGEVPGIVSIVLERCPSLIDVEERTHLLKIDGEGGISVNLNRAHVYDETKRIFQRKTTAEMRGRIHANFINEEGIDAGGLSREWMSLVTQAIVEKLFVRAAMDNDFYVPNMVDDSLDESDFRFAGQFIAMCALQGYSCGIPLIHTLFVDYDEVDPVYILRMIGKGTFVDQMLLTENLADLNLSTTVKYDNGTDVDVCPGQNLTNDNAVVYLQRYCEHMLFKQYGSFQTSFKNAFYDVLFNGGPPKYFVFHEYSDLIGGIKLTPEILKSCITFNGPSIVNKFLFDFIDELSHVDLQRLLQFITGQAFLPLHGVQEGYIKIRTITFDGDAIAPLPIAHTCGRSMDLPAYRSRSQFKTKVLFAIRNCITFGFG
ncbi:hypothetical protein PCE1_003436 [Barthelona sp. PCE]